jgi:hypothetical protein
MMRSLRTVELAGSVALVCLSTGVVFGQAIIHVPTDAPTIQIAIQEAQPFDTIIVAPDTYFEAINFQGKVIAIQSENPNDPQTVADTIIDAGGLGTVVTFAGTEGDVHTALDGFTITGGTIGIDGHSTRAAIRHCVIRDNSSYGIYQADGIIEDSQILNNNSVGIKDCDGTIRRCVIRNNGNSGLQECDGTTADSKIEQNLGGGVDGGSVDIVRCVVASNGWLGIYRHWGDVEQSFLVGNGGYGIRGDGADGGVVRNCVIAGNRDSGFNSSRKHVLNCTVTANTRYGFDNHSGSIKHTIIWSNTLGALTSSTTPIFSGTTNPFFVQPGHWDPIGNVWIDGDHLMPDSPYIDAGDPNYPTDPNRTTEDLDGNPRVAGARVDIGAYEFQSPCEGADFDQDGTPDICDRDIDNDGVTNTLDACDFTAPDVPVDSNGRAHADLNHDCEVNLRDYAVFQASFR